MNKEETLLEAARQALHVLNMLWDDGRVKEILKARSDLDTALNGYEPVEDDIIPSEDSTGHKGKYWQYIRLFESYTHSLIDADDYVFVNTLNDIITKVWEENVPTNWGLRVKPWYSLNFNKSNPLRLHNGRSISRVSNNTILDFKEGYTFNSKARVKQLRLDHPLWEKAAEKINEFMLSKMTPEARELCVEVQGIIANYSQL